MIEMRNLSKRYGDKLAVDGLDFVVQPGVVTGFLGPNGAGKSTTMRLIAGLDEPTTGSIRVNGKDYSSAVAPMAELGLLLEAKAMHTGRSARNHLLALAQTNGISRRRVDEVIDMVGLREVADKRVGGFSLGMGQRLGVAQALLGDPEVVVLDEPVNGLDPEGVLWIRNLLKGLAADGRTVFVSSHLMSEMTAVVLTIGIGALFSAVTANQYHTFSAADKASFNPITTSLNGILFSQLAIGVLGVLLISGEYSTGMIRSSLTAVPRRLPVLWAKLGVFAGVAFAVMLVTSFVSFFVGQALLSSHHLGVSISAPNALRDVIGAALYVTVAGIIGMTLGALMRNTAAGISTMVAVFFVLPPVAGLLPSSWSSHFVQYLPSNAGGVLYGGASGLAHPLASWTGFGLLCAYAAVLIGFAAWRLRRADA
jgi:ABC-type multidrug transport system ATPase subunit